MLLDYLKKLSKSSIANVTILWLSTRKKSYTLPPAVFEMSSFKSQGAWSGLQEEYAISSMRSTTSCVLPGVFLVQLNIHSYSPKPGIASPKLRGFGVTATSIAQNR